MLGVDADAPLNGWQEAFLPQSLSESLTRIELPAEEGMPARPIVEPVDTVYRAEREAEPRGVAWKLGATAGIGAVIGFVLLILTRLGRVSAAVAIGGWSFIVTLVGLLLLYMWFATKHVFMANNPSVALANPVWIVGAVAAVQMFRGGVSVPVRSALRWLLVVAVTGTAGAVLLGHAGSAIEMAALLLPGHAAVVYAADRFRAAARASAKA